ncbi:MAG TPA: hypothetical protein VFS68_02105 [Candidatus Udaeobacter sp.]|nr:hypothetical protein [Candidatus Udaeobacter sp.]
MKNLILMSMLILGVTMIGACGGPGGFYDNSPQAQREASARHAEAVERLLPEDAPIKPQQLAALIEAIRTVRPDIPKEELPQNSNAVRRVLKGMSQSDLRRVESILPAVERRRRAEGVD